MVAWLENGSDRPADTTVWGVEKSVYYFKDLEAFFGAKGAEKRKREVEGQG